MKKQYRIQSGYVYYVIEVETGKKVFSSTSSFALGDCRKWIRKNNGIEV